MIVATIKIKGPCEGLILIRLIIPLILFMISYMFESFKFWGKRVRAIGERTT